MPNYVQAIKTNRIHKALMKLFSVVASALGLAYPAEEVAEAPEVADVWQTASNADRNIWKNDGRHAASTSLVKAAQDGDLQASG